MCGYQLSCTAFWSCNGMFSGLSMCLCIPAVSTNLCMYLCHFPQLVQGWIFFPGAFEIKPRYEQVLAKEQ